MIAGCGRVLLWGSLAETGDLNFSVRQLHCTAQIYGEHDPLLLARLGLLWWCDAQQAYSHACRHQACAVPVIQQKCLFL